MRYASIRDLDISNGEGVGVALFVQGCHFHCKDCFNQSTWDFNGGNVFDDDKYNEFIHLIDRPYIDRISILGGEPLDNYDDVLCIVKDIKKRFPNKSIWIYTGYKYENLESKTEILNYIDFLVDGQFETENKNLSIPFAGSTNQRVIDIKKSIKENTLVLYEEN